MSTPQPTNDDAERIEQIVAYLDDELLPEESARVESQLASDEQFRQELQSIERAWSALDELPAATVDDKFSKTTLELVVGDARRELEQKTQTLPIQRRKRNLSTVLLVIAAALLGGLAVRLVAQNPNRALLADLPVIYGIDAYSQFRDVQYLRKFQEALGENAWPADVQDVSDLAEQFRLVGDGDTGEDWLENAAADERAALRAKYNRFRALSAERQEQLRQLHSDIASADDSAQLQQTMLQYQQWLNSLPASQQYELRELSAQDRAGRVVSMIHQQAVDETIDLTPDQLRAFFEAILPQLQEMREQVMNQMSPQDRKRLEALPKDRRRTSLFWLARLDAGRRADELNRLVLAAIPQEKRDAFEQLSQREQWERFQRWMRQAAELKYADRSHGAGRRPEEPGESELETFFAEELDAATQERLLALPREKMLQQLKRLYRGNLPHSGWRMPQGHRGPSASRPGPPPPGEGRRHSDPPGRRPFHERPEGRP